MKISKADRYFLLILLFMFQPAIERIIGPFKYYDELFVLFFFILFIKEGEISKKNNTTLLIYLCLTIVGLIGNVSAGAGQVAKAVFQDFLSNAKLIFFAVAVSKVKINDNQKNKLADRLAFTIRFLFVLMLFLAIISQFINIGMTENIRYGFKSFQFIFYNPAGLNTYFYLYMIIHSITLYKNGKLRPRSDLFTIIGVLSWFTTLRSRAIAFGIIYLVIYFYIVHLKKDNKVFKFRWYQVLIAAMGAALLSWDAIEKYFFSNDRAARYQLSRISFLIAKNHFPFGTGFGTFGTEASRAYYSSVYYDYGLSSIWGLNPEHTSFITDQYWFAILGQFGFLGLFLMIILIYRIYKDIWSFAKVNKNSQLAALTLFFTSMFASLTAGTFIQASIISSVLVLYVLGKSQLVQGSNNNT